MEMKIVSRKSNNFIKSCIVTALIELMKERDFDQITITEIANKAGVSRMAYYRYYTSKNDILVQYLDEVTGQIIPVAELAGKFHLSRNQFTRIFTSYWGITPSEYQIRSRINQAKYLLGSTDLSIRAIAAELGYADHYFFARQFKQKTGVTPGQFRESGSSVRETDP